MRVLQVVDLLAPVGGTQTYVHDVTELLLARGHEVRLVHGDEASSRPSGAERRQLGSPDLGTWIAEFEPHVVHVHMSRVPPEVERYVERYSVVHSLHNFAFACASGTKYFRGERICSRAHGLGCLVGVSAKGCAHRLDLRPAFARYRRIERELPSLRRADGIVVHSDFVRSVALANGLPAERVAVVPYMIASPSPPSEPLSERTIAFAGRTVREKGLDVLLEALAGRPDAWDRLSVAGEGYDLERCRRLAASRGIAGKVEFLGHIDVPSVRETLAQARVVVVPSRWPEPFGIVGLEAMAVGRPVVASAVGGIPEWLDDGRTGILVPPGDSAALGEAITSLLADPARAVELGVEGRRQVERFSPEAHAEKLLAVYERAIGVAHEPGSKAAAA